VQSKHQDTRDALKPRRGGAGARWTCTGTSSSRVPRRRDWSITALTFTPCSGTFPLLGSKVARSKKSARSAAGRSPCARWRARSAMYLRTLRRARARVGTAGGSCGGT